MSFFDKLFQNKRLGKIESKLSTSIEDNSPVTDNLTEDKPVNSASKNNNVSKNKDTSQNTADPTQQTTPSKPNRGRQ